MTVLFSLATPSRIDSLKTQEDAGRPYAISFRLSDGPEDTSQSISVLRNAQ